MIKIIITSIILFIIFVIILLSFNVKIEYFNSGSLEPVISGDYISDNIDIDNVYYMFRSGTSTFTIPSFIICDIFMIGGGGEGGTNCGGGGGAGAAIIAINQTLPAGAHTITVGAGGSGSVGGASTGNTGGDTSIGSLFIARGGGGGGGNGTIGNAGGCSGGTGGNNNSTAPNPVATNVVNGVTGIGPSTTSTYAVVANKGGNGVLWNSGNYRTIKGAGGGGIGAVGTNATTSTSGTGGDGIYQITIGGTTYNLKNHFTPNTSFGVNDGNGNFFIGGGGGGGGFGSGINVSGGKGGGGVGRDDGSSTTGANGVANTGSGGGGGGANTASNNSSDGGSGVVIIRINKKINSYIDNSSDCLVNLMPSGVINQVPDTNMNISVVSNITKQNDNLYNQSFGNGNLTYTISFSKYFNDDYIPTNLFLRNNKVSAFAIGNYNNGIFNTNINTGLNNYTEKGEFIHIRLPSAIILKRFGFRADSSAVPRAPGSWVLYTGNRLLENTNVNKQLLVSNTVRLDNSGYCQKNQFTYYQDIQTNGISGNELLFIFPSLAGSGNVLSFMELLLFSG